MNSHHSGSSDPFSGSNALSGNGSLQREGSTPPDKRIYSAIINQSPIGISVRDRNGNLVICNRSWANIWEMSEDAVQRALSIRKTSLTMDEKDSYLGENQKRVRDVYENGGDLILDAIYSPGMDKWIQQRFYGIEGLQGVIDFVVVLTEDVTEKKKSEEIETELQMSLMKYRKLVDNLPVAAYTTDSRGHCTSANPAMVHMFEEDSIENLFDIPVSERYLNKSDRDVFLGKMSSAGEIQGYEVELVTSRGRAFWASISATATFDETGNITTVDGVIRDISAVKVLEREILKNQKLESIGILAGGIAHDFNNILSAVLGNISLAKLYALGDEKIGEKLTEAERATIRASELTKQLLTFSRGGKPVRKTCDLREVVKESASFASTGSRAAVSFAFPDNLWAAEVDESQIGQVVNNLVMNSIQACPEGCRVAISMENTILGADNSLTLKPGFYIKLSVKDDGPGIPRDLQHRVFDPYFTTKSSGSGLGLATVYSIVKNHAGSIVVESSPASGCSFIIYIPSLGNTIQTESEAVELPEGRGRILVMDDEESVRKVVSEILDHHGYRTDTASHGSAAVEMYRSAFLAGSPYDVVITDVTVPGGMGGVEAARCILGIDPSARLIVASGYSNNDAVANFRDHGFLDSIVKPFTLNTLLKSVEKVLNE